MSTSIYLHVCLYAYICKSVYLRLCVYLYICVSTSMSVRLGLCLCLCCVWYCWCLLVSCNKIFLPHCLSCVCAESKQSPLQQRVKFLSDVCINCMNGSTDATAGHHPDMFYLTPQSRNMMDNDNNDWTFKKKRVTLFKKKKKL